MILFFSSFILQCLLRLYHILYFKLEVGHKIWMRNTFLFQRASSFMNEAGQIIGWSQHDVIILIKSTIWGSLLLYTLALFKSFFKLSLWSFTKTLCVKVWVFPYLQGKKSGFSGGDTTFPRSSFALIGCKSHNTISSLLDPTHFNHWSLTFASDMCYDRESAECDGSTEGWHLPRWRRGEIPLWFSQEEYSLDQVWETEQKGPGNT